MLNIYNICCVNIESKSTEVKLTRDDFQGARLVSISMSGLVKIGYEKQDKSMIWKIWPDDCDDTVHEYMNKLWAPDTYKTMTCDGTVRLKYGEFNITKTKNTVEFKDFLSMLIYYH